MLIAETIAKTRREHRNSKPIKAIARDLRLSRNREDIQQSEESVRDAMIEAKARVIAAKLEAMLGEEFIKVERTWAAAYGGNGIAFAGLAAELLDVELFGTPDPDALCFIPYRFA